MEVGRNRARKLSYLLDHLPPVMTNTFEQTERTWTAVKTLR